MVKDNQLVKLIPTWAKRLGLSKAKRELIVAGVGISTADFMVRGEYYSTPREEMVLKIRLAMKDFLSEREAS